MKNTKTRVFYIQEILASYRKPLIDMLSREYDLTVFSGVPTKKSGFKAIIPSNAKLVESPCIYFFNNIFYQKNIIKNIIIDRPSVILTSASTRNMSYWFIIVLCKVLNIKVFSHGQGLYSKPKPSIVIKIAYRIISAFTYKYICYSYISKDMLINAGVKSSKILVAENSISINFDTSDLIKSGNEKGILFVGRLRENCKLEDLIEAVRLLRECHKDVLLHIVGTGEKEEFYREKYDFDWIIFYGAIYHDEKIYEISKVCRYGCYPGDAGLSVVHYFALKLPPIVHGSIVNHMGPEPSYVDNGFNGIIFDRDSGANSIYEVLSNIWNISNTDYLNLSNNAYLEYRRLNDPPLEVRIIKIINQYK